MKQALHMFKHVVAWVPFTGMGPITVNTHETLVEVALGVCGLEVFGVECIAAGIG